MAAYIVLHPRRECGSVVVLMALRTNKPLRNLGIYKLRGEAFILLKRSEALSFFSAKETGSGTDASITALVMDESTAVAKP